MHFELQVLKAQVALELSAVPAKWLPLWLDFVWLGVQLLVACGPESVSSWSFLEVARSGLARPARSGQAFEPLEAHVCGRVDNNQLPLSAFYWRHQIAFPWKSALQQRAELTFQQNFTAKMVIIIISQR